MVRYGKKVYLAYGSNLNLDQMAVRCPTARVLGSVKLRGWKLLFRGDNGGAYATIEKEKGCSVPALAWEIAQTDEVALDRYERWPELYQKELVKIYMDGKWLIAMLYIMNEGRPIGAPNRFYYNAIRSGYNAAGFDVTGLNKALRQSLIGDARND